jgi:hypothetical protein
MRFDRAILLFWYSYQKHYKSSFTLISLIRVRLFLY